MGRIEPFLREIERSDGKTARPLVTLSYAQSLDGSLTARRGSTLSLSGPLSQQLTHRLRAAHQAILVGVGTVLADNPRLTVRLAPGASPQPVVLDSQLRLPLDANLMQASLKPWILTSQAANSDRSAALETAGARLVRLPQDGTGRLSTSAALAFLYQAGIQRLMVEGGARVISSFLEQRLADLLVVTIAPVLLGGLRALESKGEEPLLPAMIRLGELDFERLGDDLVVWGKLT